MNLNNLFLGQYIMPNLTPAEKRKKTIERKRAIKEAKRDAYHAKREHKYILQAGEAFHEAQNISNKANFNKVIKEITKRKPVMNFDKLLSYVKNWQDQYNQKNRRFSLTLKSGVSDVERTFKFNDIKHFNNFYDRVSEDYQTSRDTYTGENHQIDMTEAKHIFRLVDVKNIEKIRGGCNHHKACDKVVKTPIFNFTLFNPSSKNNDCFFACLKHFGYDVNASELREKYKIPLKEMVDVDVALTILNDLDSNIEIIDESYNEELFEDSHYILIKNNHYYVVKSFTSIIKKDMKTKRGLMTFDLETRETEDYHLIEASSTKSFILKDTICCVYYRPYKQTECKSLTLISGDKTSSRQFIDFLNEESKQGRTYNIIAHNGGKFDFYFLIGCMTSQEILDSDLQMRGTTVIGINYKGNSFRDSYCFMNFSLKKLCENFKIGDSKLTTFNINGVELTNEQLCFYKPELTFNSFMNLKHNEPTFWVEYEKYCLYDCISLFQIWEKFQGSVNELISNISPTLLSRCPLMASTTIGSHAKKILESCVSKGKKEMLLEFLSLKQIKRSCEYIGDFNNNGESKYEFMKHFKRGGISHCNQMGKHNNGITSIDITSQYPSSLIYGMCPIGYSKWVTTYEPSMHGFYHLKDVIFKTDYKFKPVADSVMGTSLNWACDEIKDLYIDTYMIKYLRENYGLLTFKVVEGLVSRSHIKMSDIFGSYVNTFFSEKKRQDTLKDSKDKNYNPAYRETIKLYLNSLTGKLVEDPSIHYTLKYDDEGSKTINGVKCNKELNTGINMWITAGCMVYSYSKRLLFEYIKCLEHNSNSVIAVETDGIYFSTKDKDIALENINNYSGSFECIKLGDDLGNVKIEKSTTEGNVAYFLGKKFYCITDEKGDTYKIKGIPQNTINDDGSEKQLVDRKLYEDVYNGKTVERTFKTMRKSLYNEKTQISGHKLSRTIRPSGIYKEYN
jgi:hypothetical protein